MSSNKITPTMIIDLHGVKAALTSTNNLVRVSIVDAIQSGRMQIIKGVSEELKNIDDDLYKEFQAIKPKKYVQINLKHHRHGTMISEQFGGSIFGYSPPADRFINIALAIKNKVSLVSSDNAYSHYVSISKKCAINGLTVCNITEVS